MTPEDLAASLLLFYARDGFYGLAHAADLAAWWDSEGLSLPAAFLARHLSRYRQLAPALMAAARVTENFTGAPAMAWVGGAGSTPTPRRVRAAERLAHWSGAGDPDQLRANISLVGGLLSPPGSLRSFARRELVDSSEAAEQRLLHPLKMGWRYAIALWRVRGGRWWARQQPGT